MLLEWALVGAEDEVEHEKRGVMCGLRLPTVYFIWLFSSQKLPRRACWEICLTSGVACPQMPLTICRRASTTARSDENVRK